MEKIKKIGERENGRVIGGLILVAVGVALLLRNMGYFMPHWLFTWPMILILVGIYTGFKHEFRNPSWLILVGIGTFFLVNRYIPGLGLQPLFWPIVVIGLGIAFILRPGRFQRWNFKTGSENDKNSNASAATPGEEIKVAGSDRSDYLVVESVFSGVNRNVVSKDFRGGYITTVFGGAEIDLSQADVTGRVVMKFEVVFGGVKIVVPPHWAIQNEIGGVFHAVDDKRKFNPSASINPEKVVILEGSVVFGGIEIRSY